MINVVAPNIKNGGGLELLIYLLEHLNQNYTQLKVSVYIDSSIEAIAPLANRRVIRLKSTYEKIKLFSKKIDNTIYFGNLPPLRRSNNSIVYLHNIYLLLSLQELAKISVKFLFKYFFQQQYIRFFIKNADTVACQSEAVKKKFIKKFSFDRVQVLPFFRVCNHAVLEKSSKFYDFCYVSLAHPHKNHINLLEACELLSDMGICFSLALTIEDGHNTLIDRIEKINFQGVGSVVNLGLLSKAEVCGLYAKSRCLVFPSTQESFGLGLIEAVHMGLDVIASDLEYVFQAIEPSAIFDPADVDDIARAMEEYLSGNPKRSLAKISNSIDQLITSIVKGIDVQK